MRRLYIMTTSITRNQINQEILGIFWIIIMDLFVNDAWKKSTKCAVDLPWFAKLKIKNLKQIPDILTCQHNHWPPSCSICGYECQYVGPPLATNCSFHRISTRTNCVPHRVCDASSISLRLGVGR